MPAARSRVEAAAAAGGASPAIRVAHLCKRYGSRSAVSDVSFEVAPGEIVAFLGPRGSGKSTLLKMLATVVRPTSGMVRVAGFDAVTAPRDVRLHTAFIAAATPFNPRQTPRETLRQSVPFEQRLLAGMDVRVDRVLGQAGLTHAADEPIPALPAAERCRLAIARALLASAEILLLDEPTVTLDPQASAAIREDLVRLNATTGLTVVFTTTDPADAEITERVGILVAGRIAAFGPPAEQLPLLRAKDEQQPEASPGAARLHWPHPRLTNGFRGFGARDIPEETG